MLLALCSGCSNTLERLAIVDDEDGEICVCVCVCMQRPLET